MKRSLMWTLKFYTRILTYCFALTMSSDIFFERNYSDYKKDFSFLLFCFCFCFLHSRFLLVINFIHISVYMSIPIAQFSTPPSPPPCGFPPLVSTRLSSTSVSQLLPCKPVHLYHFSRFHIHALIYDICFSLSDLLQKNNCKTLYDSL